MAAYKYKVEIELYLVGSDFDESILKLSAWGLCVNLVIYDYMVDGIKFDYIVQKTNNQYLKEAYSTKPESPDVESFIEKLKHNK